MEEQEQLKNITALPKRYEDTKPALNQAFVHESIIDIGQRIFERSQEVSKAETDRALRSCEAEVWQKAEVYKDECVERSLLEAKQREERRIKQLTQQHEKQMKNELSRLEGIVYQKGMEKVFQEKQAGEKKLNEVVAKLHQNFVVEKTAAVAVARAEEQGTAYKNAEETERLHQQALQDQHDEDVRHESQELENLKERMLEEMKQTVHEARLEEQQTAQETLNQVSEEFRNHIADLRQNIADLENKQRKTELAYNAMEGLKNSYVKKLKDTRSAFTAFIEKSRPDFFTGQSDFLIPANEIDQLDDI
uniref:Uncharacterized protein C6orf163 homolog n=1 Tax=Phallusia mammillata TaxID=59560 RepID=A0A6F9DDN5_9ASCI|nr:uncharacterized protein C6orf163 homolog [Phallusia mammillata]